MCKNPEKHTREASAFRGSFHTTSSRGIRKILGCLHRGKSRFWTEVWFRWFSFSIGWFFWFQPLIFRCLGIGQQHHRLPTIPKDFWEPQGYWIQEWSSSTQQTTANAHIAVNYEMLVCSNKKTQTHTHRHTHTQTHTHTDTRTDTHTHRHTHTQTHTQTHTRTHTHTDTHTHTHVSGNLTPISSMVRVYLAANLP